MIDGNDPVYRRTEGIEQSPVPDGSVVYDSRNREIHYLNTTATMVLDLCDGTNRHEEIAELIRSAFDLAEPPVADVGLCLADLLDKKLVEALP